MLLKKYLSSFYSYLYPTTRPLFSQLCYSHLYSFSSSTNTNIDLLLKSYIKNDKSINNLEKKGISQFFPIQAQTYELIYKGKDVIAGDKTGSGKTIAFSLPILEKMREKKMFKTKGIKFLILAPTRQLSIQIASQISSLKHFYQQFRLLNCYGGASLSTQINYLRYSNPDILVGTPGRILDLMKRQEIDLTKVQTLCIDEADHMFDIGFHKDVDEIMQNVKKASEECQYLCFTATLNKKVKSLTEKYMRRDMAVINYNEMNEIRIPNTITHYYVKILSRFEKVQKLIKILDKQNIEDKVIIFVNMKIQADDLSKQLKEHPNVVLHGDIDQRTRVRNLQDFKKGRVNILIASDVAARGLDIPNVNTVVHYQIPRNLTNYVHRSGRTGRAGKNGDSIAFINIEKNQDKQFKEILNQLEDKIDMINYESGEGQIKFNRTLEVEIKSQGRLRKQQIQYCLRKSGVQDFQVKVEFRNQRKTIFVQLETEQDADIVRKIKFTGAPRQPRYPRQPRQF